MSFISKRLGVAVAAAMMTAPVVYAQELSIATGGTGGVYFPLGGGISELINRHVEGRTATAEVTGASVENVALIARDNSDIAFALADTVYQAYNGQGQFEGRALSNLRALGAVYPNVVQIVTTANSGIDSLDDLKGRRVSVGAPGSGTEISAKQILEANGITYADFSPERLNFNETADALRDGDIVAGFWSVGPPTSSIMNLAATRQIAFVPLSDDQVNAALEVEPTFAAFTLPAGTYDGVTQDVATIATPNLLIVNADMDEELAYQIVKTIYENTDFLIATHPAAKDMTIDFSVSATPIPFHPGALRYLEEQGATIRDDQRP
ncbi:TAXI family TRAP transporter solute-binding subunit [Paracoccus sp. (in: a-proteobacteria)]|uniref:TAXI family TRAP transporter solute-binding subunit n=1 Tax=Paracoccus sp. TaxID=267 RepID=UPI0026E09CDE|nr:TAXI family TRAP transporter solute-binding subunit [Paracoccus sp. (in: a-proteobacteria)]MDO5648124.1 TAXI family TRAP transporter solute-binding subunit [Paracoccus sp. (in: a-proteobacteria)]